MDHQAIRDNGWLQGSVFGRADHGSLIDYLPDTIQVGENDCLIVVSHSCDVLNRSAQKEPYVEVCVAKPCEHDNSKRNGKNSRLLQVSLEESGTAHAIEIHAKDRFFLPRTLLAELYPDPDRQLNKSDIEILRSWLAARYHRSAFPDAFNERTNQAFNNVRKRAKAVSAHVSAIFIALDPQEEELPDGQSYSVAIIGAIPDEILDVEPDARQQVDLFLTELATQLAKCKGIRVVDHDAQLESEISIRDLRHLRRLDYDDLSFKGDDPRAP